jgi:tetratricopeptide (TPR) repeat protein
MAQIWQNADGFSLNEEFTRCSHSNQQTIHFTSAAVKIRKENSTMNIKHAFIAATLTMTLASSPVFAFPGGGTTEKSEPSKVQSVKPSAKKLQCKRGETAKMMKRSGKSKWTCVKLKAEVLPDTDLYNQARMLADAGEYEWALDHLRLITNQHDAEVLNYTGYANRKAGRLETGIAYYQQALSINPDYVQAREYLGEAYVLAGFNNLAVEQLNEIANRCGTTCDTYIALERFIQQ